MGKRKRAITNQGPPMSVSSRRPMIIGSGGGTGRHDSDAASAAEPTTEFERQMLAEFLQPKRPEQQICITAGNPNGPKRVKLRKKGKGKGKRKTPPPPKRPAEPKAPKPKPVVQPKQPEEGDQVKAPAKPKTKRNRPKAEPDVNKSPAPSASSSAELFETLIDGDAADTLAGRVRGRTIRRYPDEVPLRTLTPSPERKTSSSALTAAVKQEDSAGASVSKAARLNGQTIRRLNEGLTCETSFAYHSSNNKRTPCKQSCDQCYFSRKLTYQLPLMLTKEAWTRHGYSLRDIDLTISRVKLAKHLWCLGQLEQLRCSKQSSKASYANPAGVRLYNTRRDQFIYGGKKLIHNNLMTALEDSQEFLGNKNVLINPDDLDNNYRLPLPCHHVSSATYKALLVDLPTEFQMQEDYVKRNRQRVYKVCYTWRDTLWVPRTLQENGLIFMDRIVAVEVYNAAFAYQTSLNSVPCLTLMPARVVVNGRPYIVTDEAFYAAHEKFRGAQDEPEADEGSPDEDGDASHDDVKVKREPDAEDHGTLTTELATTILEDMMQLDDS